MHSLDEFMLNLSTELDRHAVKKANPIYNRERYQLMKSLDSNKASLKERFRAFKALRKKLKRAGHQIYIHETTPQHIHFVRYADDFVISVIGNKDVAKRLTERIQNYIQSDLQLNVSENNIRHTRSDKTPFLGFLLSVGVLGPRVKGRTLERFQRLKTRIRNNRKREYIHHLRMLGEAKKRF